MSMHVKDATKGDGRSVRQSLSPLSKLFSNRRNIFVIFGIVIAAFIVCYGISLALNGEAADKGVSVSGRIESMETRIVAATGTRVKAVHVKEGDRVKKGQLLVELESQMLDQKIGMAGHAIDKARVAQREADRQVAAVQTEIAQARKKSKGFWSKVFSTKKGRAKKESELRGKMMQAKMMQMQAQGFAAQASAARSQAQSKVSYFRLTSPIDGIVATRSTQPGELVAQGQVLITIEDSKSSYLRGFIPESDLARVSVGQSAEVYLASDSTKPYKGKVAAIDPAPSFTPQNVYFNDDKIRQSFGLKITIDNPDGRAKPGMEAEAKIALVEEKGD